MRVKSLRGAVGAALVLAGAMGGASAQTLPSPAPVQAQSQPPSQPKPPRFEEIVSRMSTPGQAIMVEAVNKSAYERKKLQALKSTREQILTLIAAPQVDADALTKAFERERILSQKLQAARHEALLKATSRLSQADRQIFAEGLRATRLHIPGETIRQIRQRTEEARKACAENKQAAPDKAAR